jgi:uncharacterized protein involved in exopolysaccharide biosynthesis
MQNDVSQDRSVPLDFFQICAIVWNRRWTLVLITVIVLALSTVYAFTARERFRAEVLLRPADTRANSGGLSSQLGGLGGLASIAGINLNTNNSAEPVAVLTSREFTAAFIEDLNLLPVLFPKRWDAVSKQWKPSMFSGPPDIRDAVRYFNKTVRAVQEDKKTGFITMSVEWTDPKIAADWANVLVDRLNARMRERALAESTLNVAYLKEELGASNLVALQQSIGRVLENELQKLMLAKATKEYSFKIIDHAQPPKWHSWPRRALIIGGGLFFGIVGSALFIATFHIARLRFREAQRRQTRT